MSADERFIDTNILLYLFSDDIRKANLAEQVVASGGLISVQVLNEFASVATRKIKMSVPEIREAEFAFRAACAVLPITEETHARGLNILEQYGLSIYDAMIVASALLANCKILISEDMQAGQLFDNQLRIENPFK
jgi:predicted nucleic acid-binding protein